MCSSTVLYLRMEMSGQLNPRVKILRQLLDALCGLWSKENLPLQGMEPGP
jgi:hypothetical protein